MSVLCVAFVPSGKQKLMVERALFWRFPPLLQLKGKREKNQIHKITSLTHLNLEKKNNYRIFKKRKNKYFQLTFMTSFFQSFGGNSSLI